MPELALRLEAVAQEYQAQIMLAAHGMQDAASSNLLPTEQAPRASSDYRMYKLGVNLSHAAQPRISELAPRSTRPRSCWLCTACGA